MKKILILGAGETNIPIIEKSREMGLYTVVTDYDKNAPGLPLADAPYVEDTLDEKSTLEIAKKHKIDGIITNSDYPVNTVAHVCEELGLTGLNKEAAEISTNKFLQRQALANKRFAAPRFIKTDYSCDLDNLVKNWNLPLIVKPLDSSGSRGVARVNDIADFKIAFADALNFSKSGKVIIEEYIEGKEYSVESLTQNGETSVIAITEKYIIDDLKYFVEERHIVPAAITIKEEEQMIDYVKKVINLFGLDNCASHAEIKLTDNGPVLIELGARLGGDFITSDLVRFSTGVDMVRNSILISLNQKIQIEKTETKFSGVQFIYMKNYDKAIKFQNEENFSRKKEIKPFREGTPKQSAERLGYFIFQESSRTELDKKIDFLLP